MTPSARLLFLFLLTVGFGAALAGGKPHSLRIDEIIRRNTEAMGGRAAIEAVQSVEVDLHVSNLKFEVDGVYRAARPGRMRIDITAGGKHVFTEAFDGERGWQWDGKEKKNAGPTASGALRHGVELPGNLFGLHELRLRGHRVELIGREKIDGVDYYALRVTLADGFETSLFLDPETWRITRRRDVRALHPDLDPTLTTIEARKSDFRQIDGVWFSFKSEDVDLKTGKVIESTNVKEIRVNPVIDVALFHML